MLGYILMTATTYSSPRLTQFRLFIVDTLRRVFKPQT
jgi:hypothetical protein